MAAVPVRRTRPRRPGSPRTGVWDSRGMTGDRPRPEREVLEYYGRGEERDRLEVGYGPLERERTRGSSHDFGKIVR